MGLATAGIGAAFQAAALANGGLTVGQELFRAGLHGLNSGAMSNIQGGSFIHGFASGSFGSVAGSAFAGTPGGSIIASSLGGGFGAYISGGNVLEGVGRGFVIGAFNHTIHHVANSSRNNPDPPTSKDPVDYAFDRYFNAKHGLQAGGSTFKVGSKFVRLTKTSTIFKIGHYGNPSMFIQTALNPTYLRMFKYSNILFKSGVVAGSILLANDGIDVLTNQPGNIGVGGFTFRASMFGISIKATQSFGPLVGFGVGLLGGSIEYVNGLWDQFNFRSNLRRYDALDIDEIDRRMD